MADSPPSALPPKTRGGPVVLLVGEEAHLKAWTRMVAQGASTVLTATSRAQATQQLRKSPVDILIALVQGGDSRAATWFREAGATRVGLAKIAVVDDPSPALLQSLVNRGGVCRLFAMPLTPRGIHQALKELEPASVVVLPAPEKTAIQLTPPSPEWQKALSGGESLERRLSRMESSRNALAMENETLRSQIEMLRIHSTTDPLTGLSNRREFETRLRGEWGRYRRYHRPLSAVMLDIDFFKSINDTHGHECGDVVLTTLASLIRRHQREHDLTCRYGGEEFIVLMPETTLGSAFNVAEGLRRLVARYPFRCGGKAIAVRISMGVAGVLEHDPPDVETFLRFADLALYRAKNEGRNRTVILDPKDSERILRIGGG
ncbi:MAG: GGDEF domain-containing protein [Deltaproteobacteria bacterium]|nr:GGDEF domain-containing protein [Deltaproteobacteria bacterium]